MSELTDPARINERPRDGPTSASRLRPYNSGDPLEIELPDLGVVRAAETRTNQRVETMPTEIVDTESDFDLSRRNTDALMPKGSITKKKTYYKRPSFVPSELANRFEKDEENALEASLSEAIYGIPELDDKGPLFKKAQEFLRSSDKSAIFKCVCFFIFLGVGLGLLIPFFLFHFGTKDQTLTGLSGSFEYIYLNLNSPPILNITLKPNGTSCPNDYVNITLSNYTGTQQGCYCPGDPVVLKGACNNDECMDIAETGSQPLHFWKTQSLCVKYANETKAVNCTALGLYECYPGGCFPSASACPLTNLNITNTSMTSSAYSSQNISSSSWLNTFKTVNASPVIAVEVSLYGKNCFDENALPYSTSYYPLVPQIPSGCGTNQADSNTYIIDLETVYDYYNQNYILEELVNMTFYERSMLATSANLVMRKRILLNQTEDCINLDTTALIEASQVLETMNDAASFALLLAFAIHFSLAFGSLTIYCFMRSGLYFKSQVFQKKGFQAYYLVLSLIECAVYIFLGLRIVKYRLDLSSYNDYFTTLTTLNCFQDTQTIDAIGAYSYVLDNVAAVLLNYSIALAMSLSVIELFLLLGLLGTKSYPEKETHFPVATDQSQ